MFCQYCGRTVRDGAAFCPNCGKPVGLQDQAQDAPAGEPLEQTGAAPAEAPAQACEQDSAPADTGTGAAGSAQAPQDNSPAPSAAQSPKKSHTALIAGIAVGAIFALIALGVVLFAIPLFQGAKKASANAETVIALSDLEDSAWAGYLSQNVDKNGDGLISRREAELVTSIGDLSKDLTCGNGLCSAGVFDLEGIECFTNLKVLLVYDNYLSELDLSDNTSLRYLDCSANILSELELPDTDSLETVYAYDNMFFELDVTECPNLTNLSVDPGVKVTGWTGEENAYVYNGGSWLGYDYGDEYDFDYDELLDELLDEDESNGGDGSTEADSTDGDLQNA